MILKLVNAFLDTQSARIRRSLRSLGLLMAAVAMLAVALVFAILALFWLLATYMLAWQAAAIVACLAMTSALILWLVARNIAKPRTSARLTAESELRAYRPRPAPLTDASTTSGDAVALITVALAAGLAIGRRISR